MKPSDKLKELDQDMYYILLAYKDRYYPDFLAVTGQKSLWDCSKEEITLWAEFVTGRMYTNFKEQIIPNL